MIFETVKIKKGMIAMKNLKKVITVTIIIALMFTLSACSSYSSIESRMNKAGFTSADSDSTETKTVAAAINSMEIECTVHTFSKKYKGTLSDIPSFAVVLEFSSNEEMQKALEEKINNNTTLQGFLEGMEKSSYVNGNCILIPICIPTLSTSDSTIRNDIVTAFKG